MATHSSVLTWRLPGTGEPGGLPSMGSHRVRHDWSDLAVAAAPAALTEEGELLKQSLHFSGFSQENVPFPNLLRLVWWRGAEFRTWLQSWLDQHFLPPGLCQVSASWWEKKLLWEFGKGQARGIWGSLVAQMVKNLPTMWKTWVWSLGREDPLEKGIAIHSSILAWKIPWAEEPGGLQPMGSQRARHDSFFFREEGCTWGELPLHQASFRSKTMWDRRTSLRRAKQYHCSRRRSQEKTLLDFTSGTNHAASVRI